jgi:hypothetical protein
LLEVLVGVGKRYRESSTLIGVDQLKFYKPGLRALPLFKRKHVGTIQCDMLAGLGRDQNGAGAAWSEAWRLPEISAVLHAKVAPLERIGQPEMRKEELSTQAH